MIVIEKDDAKFVCVGIYDFYSLKEQFETEFEFLTWDSRYHPSRHFTSKVSYFFEKVYVAPYITLNLVFIIKSENGLKLAEDWYNSIDSNILLPNFIKESNSLEEVKSNFLKFFKENKEFDI